MHTAMSEYDAMSDDALHEIGMYRCACGKAAASDGDPESRHCEAD